MKSPEEKEDINPFPEDESYQDPDSKNLKKMTLNLGKDEKIPIKIDGGPNFALVGGIEDFLFGTFCGESFGTSLEYGIQEVINWLKFNAKIYLKRMALGMDSNEYEDLACKITNHKGNPEGLFFLKYYDCNRKGIEPHLGRYGKLEKEIVEYRR